MKIVLLTILVLYIIQIISVLMIVYYKMPKGTYMYQYIETIHKTAKELWIPIFGLIILILGFTFLGIKNLWERLLSKKIK